MTLYILRLIKYTFNRTSMSNNYTFQQANKWIKESFNLLNYISASTLYLKDNYVLTRKLTHSDIKERILGHWGTVPGLNLIYLGLTASIALECTKEYSTLLVTGSGHGAPAILAGSWLDDSLVADYKGKYARNTKGMGELIHDFSWPNNEFDQFQSHITAHIPGAILEGGELGYSLGVAVGTVFDNPNLITHCIIGDGEAETGALIASLHSHKFLNPYKDGSVLPILHLNGYKISGPTVLSTMSNKEIYDYFFGFGYDPIIVDQYESKDIFEETLQAINSAHQSIITTKSNTNETPRFPFIIVRTMKGWTGPKFLHNSKIEDNNLSHGIPLKKPATDEVELSILSDWLESYNIQSYFDNNQELISDITDYLPPKQKRISQSEYSNKESYPLTLPPITDFDDEGEGRGEGVSNVLTTASDILAQLVVCNPSKFRIFSPDESESNKLDSLLKIAGRQYQLPVREHDKYIDTYGAILEILSEQVLQCWYQGYALTGRHGIFISYESFFGIVSTQIDQFIKYRKTLDSIPWKKRPSSMIYLATSTLWRQEHNGYSHQNPSLINSLIAKQTPLIDLYFPISVNTLLASIHYAYSQDNYINYITAGKTDFPQFLTMSESLRAVKEGSMVWEWWSDPNPDIVFVSIGDYQHLEICASIEILKEMIPTLKIRLVNVQRITPKGIPGLTTDDEIYEKLTEDKPVIVNFHGYPEAIKQLFFGTKISQNMTILGYVEKGGTTTPFDMQVLNKTSRFHISLFALQKLHTSGLITDQQLTDLTNTIEAYLLQHREYISLHGDDTPDIKSWKPTIKR